VKHKHPPEKKYEADDKLAIYCIRIGYSFSIYIGLLTLAIAVPENPLHFFDVLLCLFLALGMINRSRMCAMTMLIYFSISKYIQLTDSQPLTNTESFIASIILIAYFRGAYGTIRFHSINLLRA
jgi:hypothetical protein